MHLVNILYYLGSFPSLSQSFVLNEIYELEQNGHDIAVCAMTGSDANITHEEFDKLDVPIHYLESPSYTDVVGLLSTKILNTRILKQPVYRGSLKQHVGNLLRTKQCVKFVENIGWEEKIDHVHTHFATSTRWPSIYVASFYDVPCTITTHAFDLYKEPIGSYTKRILRSVDRVVTVSEYNRRYIRENFVKETPVDVVHAGIRPEKFSPSDEVVDNRLFTVARFVEKKGLRYAIEAVALVAEEIPDVEYHIVGSGKLEDYLRRRVKDLGIDENVKFLENVSDERLVKEFDEARCFLLPCVVAESGDRDGIPVALMEAMAMKTPPVSTTVSGIPELIDDGKNGLLVEPRDSEAVADAVLKLLRNDDEWGEYREKAREKVVKEFNVAKEAKKLEETFGKAQASR